MQSRPDLKSVYTNDENGIFINTIQNAKIPSGTSSGGDRY